MLLVLGSLEMRENSRVDSTTLDGKMFTRTTKSETESEIWREIRTSGSKKPDYMSQFFLFDEWNLDFGVWCGAR